MYFFQILQRLNMTESFSESMTIQNLVKGHKCKGAIAKKAEKIFLTHMEIIRLKYPMTLQKLHQDAMVFLKDLCTSYFFIHFTIVENTIHLNI